ncbi:hypothetical protein ABVT39_005148 [Epinephelus coioides]
MAATDPRISDGHLNTAHLSISLMNVDARAASCQMCLRWPVGLLITGPLRCAAFRGQRIKERRLIQAELLIYQLIVPLLRTSAEQESQSAKEKGLQTHTVLMNERLSVKELIRNLSCHLLLFFCPVSADQQQQQQQQQQQLCQR